MKGIFYLYFRKDLYARIRAIQVTLMDSYVIFTDSACDIAPELLREWGVSYVELLFRFTDSETEYKNFDMPVKDFYDKMRAGGVAKTSALNGYAFEMAFEEALQAGNDILYLGFSSGLSTTLNSASQAANALRTRYPDRKIVVIDTLSASAGFGRMVYLAKEKKAAGATIDEVTTYIQELIPKNCHWFTVDDLVYLKRGGRVSAATALVGNLLGIKPVLHVDDAGHLINMQKARGRRASIQALLQKYDETAEDKENGVVFISHGDCLADAELLAQMLLDTYGVKTALITNIGAVIGAHAGPGTIALFFTGKTR